MAKKINKTLVGILSISGAGLLFAGGAAAVVMMSQRDPTPYIEKAEAFYASGEYGKAINSYRQAFTMDTQRNPEFLMKAADIAWEIGDVGAAFNFCRTVLQIGPNEAASGMIAEMTFAVAQSSPGPGNQLWPEVIKNADNLLPSDVTSLRAFEKEKPKLAILAYLSRGSAKLASAGDNESIKQEGIEDLTRLLVDQNGLPALDPDNVQAAAMLRVVWLQRGVAEYQRTQNLDSVRSQMAETAKLIAHLIQSANEREDPQNQARAELMRLVPFGRFRNDLVNMGTLTSASEMPLPEPLIAWDDDSSQDQVLALLARVEEKIKEAEADTAAMRRDARDIGNIRIDLGTYYATIGKPEERMRLVRDGMTIYPDDLRFHRLCGELLRQDRKHEEETEIYHAALKRKPPETGLYVASVKGIRGWMYNELVKLALNRRINATDEATRAQCTAEIKETVEACTKEFGAESLCVQVITGRLQATDGKIASAIATLEDADKKRPSSVEEYQYTKYDIHELLTSLYLDQQILGNAEKSARIMVGLQPRALQPFLRLAETQIRMKKFGEAVKALNYVLDGTDNQPAIAADNLQALSLRGTAFTELGRKDEADRDFQKVQKSLPEVESILVDAARQANDKDYAAAVKNVERILANDPANLRALGLLLQISLTNGLDISKYVEKALEADPSNMQIRQLALQYRSDLSAEQKDTALLAMIDEEKDEYRRTMMRYDYFNQRGRTADADRELNKLVDMRPDDPFVIEQQFMAALANARTATGTDDPWKEAMLVANKAERLNLDQADGKTYYGRVLLAKGDAAERGSKEQREAYSSGQSRLMEAVEKFPSNAFAWAYVGQAQLNLGNLEGAETSLQKALQLQPGNGWAHWISAALCQRIATTAQDNGDDARASAYEREMKSHIKLAAEDNRMRQNPTVMAALRRVEEEDSPQEAIAKREERRANNPTDVENLVQLAGLYDRTDDLAKATEMLLAAVKQDPENLQAHFALARLYRKQEDLGRAILLLDDLLNRVTGNDKKLPVAQSLAKLLEQSPEQKHIETAYNLYRVCHDMEKSSQTALAIADFLSRRQKIAEATTWFEECRRLAVEEKKPQLADAIDKELINIAIATRDLEKADTLLKRYRSEHPNDASVLMLQAHLVILRGEYESAIEILTELIGREKTDARAYVARGEVYTLAGDLRRAIDDLRTARDYAPGPPKMPNYQHRLKLAECLRDIGNLNEALAELSNTLADARAQPGREGDAIRLSNAMVDLLLAAKPPRASDAENLLLELSNRFPDEPNWLARLGKLHADDNRDELAIQDYLRAADVANRMQSSAWLVEAIDATIRLYDKLKRPQSVVDLLSRPEYAHLPERLPLMNTLLAAAEYRLGRQDEAWTRLIDSLSKSRDAAAVFVGVARPMIDVMTAEAVLAKVSAELEANPNDPIREKMKLVMLMELNRDDEATAMAEQMIAKATEKSDKYFALFGLATHFYFAPTPNYEKAAEYYRQLLEITPDNHGTLNNLAWVLANDLKRPDEALPYAQRAVALDPSNSGYLDTLGWCQALTKNYRDARASLFLCLRAHVSDASGRMHLGLTYKMEGRTKEAETNLKLAKSLAISQGADDLLPQINAALDDLGAGSN